MSEYFAYDEVSEKYDSNRFADGVETMTFMLAGMLRKAPAEIHILDAGCGTGNYSSGFLKNGIGKVTMIDASTGMLAAAKKKVEGYGDRVVELKQHKLPSIPFSNESFDVVALIQVLHHLDSSKDVAVNIKERYKNLHSNIKEAYRVLKPGGVLLIDHCFEDNVEAISQWLTSAPKAFALLKGMFIPEKDLMNFMREEKFQNLVYVTRPGSTMLKSSNSFKPELIFDKKSWSADSLWSFAEGTGELPAIIDLINKAKEDGKLSELVKDKGKLFNSFGTSTMLFGQK